MAIIKIEEDLKITDDNKQEIVSWTTNSLANSLNDNEELPCPYPEWEKIWKTLNKDQQIAMKANIGKNDTEWKIEIIPLKIKVFPLTATPNGVDIVDENHRDEDGNAPIDHGIKLTYFDNNAAEKICSEQGKRYITDNKDGTPCEPKDEYARIMDFVNYLPGWNEADKLLNLITLFKLKSTGTFMQEKKKWSGLGDETHIVLSRAPKGSPMIESTRSIEDKRIFEIYVEGDYMSEVYAVDAGPLSVTFVCEDSITPEVI